ncbi:serine/threonine-protein kinase [Clostridium sp.]|uniref:serine/threonine-protein kinase n=1 Tax=Clostridium sp. TaxID=1506 RepID=UPI001A575474|nr:serine/threonine-protein kinase [Clostridium sp.]MBK5240100.1 serine/threonine protein kinase [Clostridium sp.]
MLNNGHLLDGKYEVIRILGKGGMGVVYLCKNIIYGNLWAIKEIIKDTKNINILTEANILKNLDHSGIRRIIDVFYENNKLYMVQDYIEGQTLDEYVKGSSSINRDEICAITLDLCDIVGYLHNQNPAIIYRDLKPSNIIITSSRKVVLIDFGISKVYKEDTVKDITCAVSNGYAAPEQYGSGKSCMQTDIYGLGMLIYFMLKGKGPYTGIEPLFDENYDKDIDDNLRIIIQKCVRIDIADRYVSVNDLKKVILDVSNKSKKKETFSCHNFGTNLFNKYIKANFLNKGEVIKTIKGFLW